MNGDDGGFGRASTDEAPTEYIPRVTDSPVPPAEAQTEVIPKVVFTPPPSSEFPDGNGNGSGDGSGNGHGSDSTDQGSEHGTRSARTSERAAKSARRRLVVLSGFGEVLITLGAVMALYVVYTLWWTNVEADKAAD